MTRLEELARKAIQRTSPCTHGMEGDEDLCDGCRYDWERSLISRIEQFGRELIEECARITAKVATESCDCGMCKQIRLSAEAIRALAEEGGKKHDTLL